MGANQREGRKCQVVEVAGGRVGRKGWEKETGVDIFGMMVLGWDGMDGYVYVLDSRHLSIFHSLNLCLSEPSLSRLRTHPPYTLSKPSTIRSSHNPIHSSSTGINPRIVALAPTARPVLYLTPAAPLALSHAR